MNYWQKAELHFLHFLCFYFWFCCYSRRTVAGLLSSSLLQLLSLVSQRHLSLCCWMLHQCDACMYTHTHSAARASLVSQDCLHQWAEACDVMASESSIGHKLTIHMWYTFQHPHICCTRHLRDCCDVLSIWTQSCGGKPWTFRIRLYPFITPLYSSCLYTEQHTVSQDRHSFQSEQEALVI